VKESENKRFFGVNRVVEIGFIEISIFVKGVPFVLWTIKLMKAASIKA